MFSFWINEVFWEQKPKQSRINEIWHECRKAKVKDWKHCTKTALAINFAEASFLSKDLWLQSKDKSIKYWVHQYRIYWWKAKDWEFFYWHNWKHWKSKYCMSEYSSKTNWWCPNWKKNFNKIFFNIHKYAKL